MNSSGISVCRTTGSYWVSSTLLASIGDDTFTGAKGSVSGSHSLRSTSEFSVNNKSFISLFKRRIYIYNKEMVCVVSLDFILPRHTSGPSPSLSVIIV